MPAQLAEDGGPGKVSVRRDDRSGTGRAGNTEASKCWEVMEAWLHTCLFGLDSTLQTSKPDNYNRYTFINSTPQCTYTIYYTLHHSS